MAMDALKNITGHVPTWLSRLDELSGQIDKRQAELAAVAAVEPPDRLSETRSLRNKGSQESLKPADDGPSWIPAPNEITESPISAFLTSQLNVIEAAPPESRLRVRSTPLSSVPTAVTPLPSQDFARDAAAAVHSCARAQAKKRTRSTSVISAEGVQTAYRTRTMIIVYYDSYVQGFFDELVRYISMSRNLLRKAKVAARMAQIKKLAELDSSKLGEDGEESLPSLRYMSSRRLGTASMRPGFGGIPGHNDVPDIYDTLDKGLEHVQSTCEHGAHQFLRDADCNEEIKKTQDKLREVLAMAETETERVLREEPELAQETGELSKVRTHRPISMRKDFANAAKDSGNGLVATKDEKKARPESGSRPVPSKDSVIEPASTTIEADAMIDVDDAIDMEYEIPKMQYRSTRALRYRAQA